MKKITSLIIFLFSISCFSQSVIEFIDSESKLPICGIYSTIYKNEDTFENCGGSNNKGFFKIRIKELDYQSKYYLQFNDNVNYKPIWKELNPNKKDTLRIYLERSRFFYDTSKEVLKSICGTYSFFGYTPREPTSLQDLPKFIQKNTIEYLKKRVGNSEFENFELIGGQIIDLKEFKKIKPKSNQKTAYYLCFSYRNIDAGISNYTSKIELDENGNIIKDIDFPIVEANSIQEKIVPLKLIIEKAQKRNFYKKEKTQFKMSYYASDNILVWKLVNETYNSDNTYLKEDLIFNAHNGNFIKLKSNKGQWVE
ncbi:hypothetical protein [Formosa sp. S-31]|uniref:hypothetical protein n=1 Tax=Formosa sp. S-31 TaxID=2790949 RepID=UPI003EB71AC0